MTIAVTDWSLSDDVPERTAASCLYDSAGWLRPPTTGITAAPNSLARRALRDSSSGSWVSAKSVPRTSTTS